MIDTSVMVARLVTNHEFHALARPHVAEAARGRVPGIVLAETWAALRRAPWNLDLLIALTCRDHDLPLVTLDRRQSVLAAQIAGLEPTLLLPAG